MKICFLYTCDIWWGETVLGYHPFVDASKFGEHWYSLECLAIIRIKFGTLRHRTGCTYWSSRIWFQILRTSKYLTNVDTFFWVFSSGQSWKLSTWTRQYRWRQMLSSRSKHYECPQTLWSLSVAPTERLTRVCKLQTDQIKQLLPTSRIFRIGC